MFDVSLNYIWIVLCHIYFPATCFFVALFLRFTILKNAAFIHFYLNIFEVFQVYEKNITCGPTTHLQI